MCLLIGKWYKLWIRSIENLFFTIYKKNAIFRQWISFSPIISVLNGLNWFERCLNDQNNDVWLIKQSAWIKIYGFSFICTKLKKNFFPISYHFCNHKLEISQCRRFQLPSYQLVYIYIYWVKYHREQSSRAMVGFVCVS